MAALRDHLCHPKRIECRLQLDTRAPENSSSDGVPTSILPRLALVSAAIYNYQARTMGKKQQQSVGI